jgi:hypothetical protein
MGAEHSLTPGLKGQSLPPSLTPVSLPDTNFNSDDEHYEFIVESIVEVNDNERNGTTEYQNRESKGCSIVRNQVAQSSE